LVTFKWNQLWGRAVVTVDGVERLRENHVLAPHLSWSYEVQVGLTEDHQVSINQTRKVFLAAFRRQFFQVDIDGSPFKVYVDGRLVDAASPFPLR
jgi:hypothetical protein